VTRTGAPRTHRKYGPGRLGRTGRIAQPHFSTSNPGLLGGTRDGYQGAGGQNARHAERTLAGHIARNSAPLAGFFRETNAGSLIAGAFKNLGNGPRARSRRNPVANCQLGRQVRMIVSGEAKINGCGCESEVAQWNRDFQVGSAPRHWPITRPT